MVVAPGDMYDTNMTLVVVELPPEAKLDAGAELKFMNLGTKHPTVKLPNGVELVGRYEESVGSLMVMDTEGDDDCAVAGKSETRLKFAPSAGGKTKGRGRRSGK